MRGLLVTLLTLFSLSSAIAAENLSSRQAVVEQQLQAFAHDEDQTAYGFAAPIVQQAFPTVDIFMSMVKNGYRPVYRNTEHTFTVEAPDQFGRPAVHVLLTDENGLRWEAIYAMEQQPDGSWKIAACYLKPATGANV